MKIFLLSTTLLMFGCSSQLTINEVVGNYEISSQMSWTRLTLNSDSTFEYKYSYDLGGERRPINGKFHIVDNKIIINSSILPQIVEARESVVQEDSLTLTIFGKDFESIRHYPFIRINEWKPDGKNNTRLILSVLSLGYWKIGLNSQITPIRTIQFTIGDYSVEYHPHNQMANYFVFQFNISGNELFRETFFVNEPFLFKDGQIYPLGPTGYEYNMEYPMRKTSNK